MELAMYMRKTHQSCKIARSLSVSTNTVSMRGIAMSKTVLIKRRWPEATIFFILQVFGAQKKLRNIQTTSTTVKNSHPRTKTKSGTSFKRGRNSLRFSKMPKKVFARISCDFLICSLLNFQTHISI